MKTMMDILWNYFLIFIMSAIPWIEILIAIPVGIGMGLNPFIVGTLSFLGNFIPVLLIVYSLQWFQHSAWYKRWKLKRDKKKLEKNALQHAKSPKQNRAGRALVIFNKYGLAGLALLGPAIIGIHVAAVIALSLKIDKHSTTLWMGGSLLVWTLFITIASVYSIDWLRSFIPI